MKKKTIKKALAIISIVVILFGFTGISVISLSSVKVSNRGSSHASNSAYVIRYLNRYKDSYPKLHFKNYTSESVSEPVLSDEQVKHYIEAFRSIKPH